MEDVDGDCGLVVFDGWVTFGGRGSWGSGGGVTGCSSSSFCPLSLLLSLVSRTRELERLLRRREIEVEERRKRRRRLAGCRFDGILAGSRDGSNTVVLPVGISVGF